MQISLQNGETEALRVGDLGPVQTDATLLDVTGMLRPFAHPVVWCCGLLDVVVQSYPFARSFRNADVEEIFTEGVVATRSSMKF